MREFIFVLMLFCFANFANATEPPKLTRPVFKFTPQQECANGQCVMQSRPLFNFRLQRPLRRQVAQATNQSFSYGSVGQPLNYGCVGQTFSYGSTGQFLNYGCVGQSLNYGCVGQSLNYGCVGQSLNYGCVGQSLSFNYGQSLTYQPSYYRQARGNYCGSITDHLTGPPHNYSRQYVESLSCDEQKALHNRDHGIGSRFVQLVRSRPRIFQRRGRR